MRRHSFYFPALVLVISTAHPAHADPVEPAPSTGVVPPAQSVSAPVTDERHRAADDCLGCGGDASAIHRTMVPPVERSEAASPRSHWYGWQTLAVDGAAVGLLATSVASGNGSTVPLGLSGATFLLGAPIVHLAHGRGGIAVASLLMRVGLATAGMFVGAKLDCSGPNESDFCGPGGAAAGLLVGAAASIPIDAAFLAREDAEPPPSRERATLSLSPTVSVTRDSGAVGLVGAF